MSFLGTIMKAAVAAPAGWIAYSAFGIDHASPLLPALPAERRSFRTAAAGNLSYYADERGDGRPLVLIHSVNAAANPQEVQPLFDHFAGSRPVYALDLPGYGFSDRSDLAYTPRLFADAIGEFLLGAFDQPVDVVALSLSCEFVALAARANPDLITSTVYVSPTGLRSAAVETGVTPPKVRVRNEGPTLKLIDKGAALTVRRSTTEIGVASASIHRVLSFPLWSQALFDLLVTRPSLRYFFPCDDPSDEVIEYCYDTAHRPGARFVPLYFVAGELFTANIAEVYAASTTATLVLHGGDASVSLERLHGVLDANDRWHSMGFDDSGPMVHQQNSVVSIAAMEDFWSRQTP